MKIISITVPEEVIREHEKAFSGTGIEYIFYRPYPAKLFRCQLKTMPSDEVLDVFNEYCFIKGSIVYMHEDKLTDTLAALVAINNFDVLFTEQF